MLKYNRTIKALTDLDGRIYLYLPDRAIKNRFEADAAEEGVTYGDGAPLTERSLGDIMALNEDMTVNFVGLAGHIQFQQVSTPLVRPKQLIRVDYGRYAAGCEDYIIEYQMVKQQNFRPDRDYRC